MSAWYNKFHHTEVESTSTDRIYFKIKMTTIFKRLGPKTVYKPSEKRPDYVTGRNRSKGTAQLPSKNNKHHYILRGRYV